MGAYFGSGQTADTQKFGSRTQSASTHVSHAPCREHEAGSSSLPYASTVPTSGRKEWCEIRVSHGAALHTLCSPAATTTPSLCCPRKGHLLHCSRLEGAEGGSLCANAEGIWTLPTKSSRCWQEEEAQGVFHGGGHATAGGFKSVENDVPK